MVDAVFYDDFCDLWNFEVGVNGWLGMYHGAFMMRSIFVSFEVFTAMTMKKSSSGFRRRVFFEYTVPKTRKRLSSDLYLFC